MFRLTPRLAAAYTFVTLISSSFQLASEPCNRPLLRIVTHGENTVFVNGVLASPRNLPEELEQIRRHLSLSDAEAVRFEGKRIVSVGEGKSPLLPYLLSLSPDTTAVDLWYGKPPELLNTSGGRELLAYVDQYRNFLIAADAANMPIESNSVDLVVSHHLINNFVIEWTDDERDIDRAVTVFAEALRILKVGGELRFFGSDKENTHSIIEGLQRVGAVNFELVRADSHEIANWGIPPFEHTLLILRKTSPQSAEH